MSNSPAQWDIPSSWKPALQAARAAGTLLLLGAADSGKSTLAAVLANEARRATRTVAVVDADIGQSSVGPPACVGMALVPEDILSLDQLHPDAIDFVGSCTPARHLLQCATGAHAMASAAADAGADTVIVDTTGLISGAFARALKGAKVRLLAPDLLIALQADDEVEHLLSHYHTRARPTVLRLPMSRAVKARSRDERASRRQMKFAAYFHQAHTLEIPWDDAPVENSPWTSGDPAPGHVRAYAEECLAAEVLYAERRADGLFAIVAQQPDSTGLRTLSEGFGSNTRALEAGALDHLLVGILGENGETLALGILEHTDFRRRTNTIFTPLSHPETARGLRLGSILIARDGTQLGSNSPAAIG